jgi:hypothetical protein
LEKSLMMSKQSQQMPLPLIQLEELLIQERLIR